MAPRKKRTFVLERDPAFTRTIGSVQGNKPNPFDVAIADAQRRIEANYPQPEAEAREAPVTTDLPDTSQPQPVEAIENESTIKPDAAGDKARADKPGGKPARRATAEAPEGEKADPEAEAQPETASAGEAAIPVDVLVTMRIPSDLAARAETWGKTLGLSGLTILRQSFARLKPQLMTELKTVKAGDIHMDRAERVGPRIQSRLRFSPAEYAAMQTRLDPADFGILPSMLNHYARARFSTFLDELMADAGY